MWLLVMCLLLNAPGKSLASEINGMLESGRVNQAIQLLQEKLSATPRDPEINFLLGSVLFKVQRFQQALVPLQNASRSPRFRVEAFQDRGVALYHLNRLPDAISELQKAIHLRANLPEALYYLISAYRMTGQKEHAYKSLVQLMQVAPDSAYTYKLMAEAYDNTGEPQEAALALRQALIQSPNLPGLHFELGMVYWQLTDYDRAIPEFKNQIRQETTGPFPARSWFYIGDIAMHRLDYHNAILDFQKSLKLEPRQYDTLCKLGQAYGLLHRFTEAIAVLRLAEQQEPKEATAHWELSLDLQKIGRLSEANQEMTLYKACARNRQLAGEVRSSRRGLEMTK